MTVKLGLRQVGKTGDIGAETPQGAQDKANKVRDDVANRRISIPADSLKRIMDVADKNPARLEYVLGFGGLVMVNPKNANERVRLSSGGIGVSTNGGASYQTAMTGAGVVAERIVGNVISGVALWRKPDHIQGHPCRQRDLPQYCGRRRKEPSFQRESRRWDIRRRRTVWLGYILAGKRPKSPCRSRVFGRNAKTEYTQDRFTLRNNSQASAVLSSRQRLRPKSWTRVNFNEAYADNWEQEFNRSAEPVLS
ncbi:hypothetical protein [Paenibacillus larvae]|uniref:hypothetical protein n=1 Tax=Paenibacillus larvae TaxID=1464 RepID=UPI002890B162|nr:hypothetical protein [Paenibacillus larvae]MDT2193413.1 hypothetical protein [Paenibacillus larvae]